MVQMKNYNVDNQVGSLNTSQNIRAVDMQNIAKESHIDFNVALDFYPWREGETFFTMS